MKYAFAIVLLCLPTLLHAGEQCTKPQANRIDIGRTLKAKPNANRVEVDRTQRIKALPAWQRALLFDPQIL